MPVQVKRGPIPYRPVEFTSSDELIDFNVGLRSQNRGFFDNASDYFGGESVYGQIADAYEERWVGNRTRVPGFDGLDHIPEGHGIYADAYAYAQSPEEIEIIRQNLEDTISARARFRENSAMGQLGHHLLWGVADPINLIAGPTLKGVGFFKGALKGGTAFGALNAGQEIARNYLDPTVSDYETGLNVGFGFAFAGLISGGIGHFAGRAGRTGAGDMRNLTAEQREIAEQMGDDFSKALNAGEGFYLPEAIDFEGQGVRIVDGPTGTTHSNGVPKKAFYRSREAWEAVHGRKSLNRAIDDLLGPVIRDGEDVGDGRPFAPLDNDEPAIRPLDGEEADVDAASPFDGGEEEFQAWLRNRITEEVEDQAGDDLPKGLYPSEAELKAMDPAERRMTEHWQREASARFDDGVAEGRQVPNSDRYRERNRPREELTRRIRNEAQSYIEDVFEGRLAFGLFPEDNVWSRIRGEDLEILGEAQDAFFERVSFLMEREGSRRSNLQMIETLRRTSLANIRRRQILSASEGLRGVPKGKTRVIQPFPTDQPDYWRFAHRTEKDELVEGSYHVDPENGDITEFGIGSSAGPRSAGPKVVLAIARQLKSKHPDAENLIAYRISGARKVTGQGPEMIKLSLRTVSPDPEKVRITRLNAGAGEELDYGSPYDGLEDLAERRAPEPGTVDAEYERMAAEGAFQETIFVDTAALRAEFPEKPWTRPTMEGVEAFPEDAFATEQEWINFVILHELHHATIKRMPDETLGAYEHRINQNAYDEMRAEKLPLSPTDSVLEKIILAPTPEGELMRLAPRDDLVHKSVNELAGDHSTLKLANKAGKPTARGGSVFQKAQRWFNDYHKATINLRQKYIQLVQGYTPTTAAGIGANMVRSTTPIIGTAARQGKLTWNQFRDFVGLANFVDGPLTLNGRTLTEAEEKVVREAVGEGSLPFFRKFEARARELEMFDTQKRLTHEIEWRETLLAKMMEDGEHPRNKAKIDSFGEEIADLRKMLSEAKATPLRHRGDEDYFPRHFNITKIKDRYDDFVALIKEGFEREAAQEGRDAGNAQLRAQEVADRILGEGLDDTNFGFGGVRQLNARVIPLSNQELQEFLVLDVDTVMGLYARRMGAAVEMHAKYGGRDMRAHIETMRFELLKRYDEKKVEKILGVVEDMRDRVLGTFHAADPSSWSNRTARALKNFGSLTLLGRVIYAQMVDVARTVAAEGFGPVFKTIEGAVTGELNKVAAGAYAREAGEALEMVNAAWAARMMENDSAFLVTKQTGIERGLAGMQAGFFNMNLMNPFTTTWKSWSSVMTGHRLLRDVQILSDAFRSGKTRATLSKKEAKIMAELASWGIDPRRAQMIADMPFEKTDSGLLLGNIGAWDELGEKGKAAKEAFLGAMSGNIRTNVVTPGPMQRAAIMDGVFRNKKGERVEMPLLSLPFQIMSFTMASGAKIGHSIASGRDRNRSVTIMALLAGGYVSARLQAGDAWEYMDWKERAYAAFDRSGIPIWLGEVAKRAEGLTGVGPRSALGLREFGEGEWSDEVGDIGGPSIGVVAGVIEAFTNDDIKDERRAQMMRRGVIANNLLWWDETMKDLADAMAEAGMFKNGEMAMEDEGEALAVSSSDLPEFEPEPVR